MNSGCCILFECCIHVCSNKWEESKHDRFNLQSSIRSNTNCQICTSFVLGTQSTILFSAACWRDSPPHSTVTADKHQETRGNCSCNSMWDRRPEAGGTHCTLLSLQPNDQRPLQWLQDRCDQLQPAAWKYTVYGRANTGMLHCTAFPKHWISLTHCDVRMSFIAYWYSSAFPANFPALKGLLNY